MKKAILTIISGACFAVPVVAMASMQPVIDVDALNELKQIHAILEQNTVKQYTCIDGDKKYTAGVVVKINGADYQCLVKKDHAEWELVPRIIR